MNRKRNHFTAKLLVILGALSCAQEIQAQNLWDGSSNIAGEAVGASLGIGAEAFIGGQFTSGDFRSPSMGKTLWSAQAQASATASYRDLYLKGNFGFDLTFGTQMMGSMFTNPGYFPVDVLEFTPGNKLKQTYDIGGGFAWKNPSAWTPGVEVKFQGINYAKRKDLRHTTYRQQFEIAPSFVYNGGNWMAGATYTFGKTSEFITASVDGVDNAQTYMAFLDMGIRYGTMQAWDGVGIHLKGDGVDRFPVQQFTNAIALQASIEDYLYADIKYTHTHGEVGEKGYVWFRFPGNSVEGKIVSVVHSKNTTHFVGAEFQWNGMDNYSVVLDKVSTGGVVTPVQYGQNRIFRHRYLCLGPSYRMRHRNGWMVGASMALENGRDLSTLMYPLYDNDQASHIRVRAMGVIPVGRFVIGAGALFISKIGEHRHYLHDTPDGTGIVSNLTRLQDWWDREQEAMDATRFAINGSLRFNIYEGLFVEAGCTWMHAFDIKLLSGCDRQTTYLKFGYNF